MIVAVIEELLDTVFSRKGKLYELRIDILFKTVVADGDTATVLGDVRYQYEKL